MSAAVVPGAKLLASTTNGPAALPFMLSPFPFALRCEEVTFACGESRAEAKREERAL